MSIFFISVDNEKHKNFLPTMMDLYRDDVLAQRYYRQAEKMPAPHSVFELCWSNEWQKAVSGQCSTFPT